MVEVREDLLLDEEGGTSLSTTKETKERALAIIEAGTNLVIIILRITAVTTGKTETGTLGES